MLPEGNDDRILRAADQLLLRGVVDLTVLGVERDIRARASALGLTLPGVRIVDPLTSPYREEFAGTYHDLRKHKGVTAQMAFDQMGDVSYFGTMMIHKGLADGMEERGAGLQAFTPIGAQGRAAANAAAFRDLGAAGSAQADPGRIRLRIRRLQVKRAPPSRPRSS